MSRKEICTPRPVGEVKTTLFSNAEEAWLWFILAQEARNDGARISAGAGLFARPCEPVDILQCVDRLYRNRRLVMDHLLVLRHYGKRQLPPDPRRMKEVRAFILWKEALERLEPVLVKKGIVRPKLSLPQPGRYWAHNAVIHEGGLNA
ncbi:MAG: hypothetical protein WCY57_05370 [Micavibrio sp.]